MTAVKYTSIRDMPIKSKLVLLIMTTCAAVLSVTILVFVIREVRNIAKDMQADLDATAEILVKNTASALIFNDRKSAQDTIDALSAKKGISAAIILDNNGAFFAVHLNDEQLKTETSQPNNSDLKLLNLVSKIKKGKTDYFGIDGYRYSAKVVSLDGESVGQVIVLGGMKPFLSRLYGIMLIAVSVMAVACVAAYLLSKRLQHLISTPILLLSNVMKDVCESKNYSLRAIQSGKDEIGHLCEGFNTMLCEIEERDQILKQRQAYLQQLAHFDTVTQLPNRALFYERLNRAIYNAERNKESLAVMFIDLDHFKNVNDTLGHRNGDILLSELARRMATMIRASDTVARLGGDEFTILLQDVKGVESIEKVACKLHEQFNLPCRLEGEDVFVSASIGITLYPFDGKSADELMMNADIAMYYAKDDGKNTYKMYDKGMSKNTGERVSLLSDLRLAVERNEFFLTYQPKVNIKTGKIDSVESLIRWRHPRLGIVLPSQFIPLAEESGLIVPMTEWVLTAACCQAKKWQNSGHPVRVAVNLSAYNFKRQNVLNSIAVILGKSSLPASLLEIEITESSLLQNSDYTMDALTSLKKMGIKISIDDFGTGYSSLSYLHRYPIDMLKIDRSFVWNMSKSDEDKAIVTAIISMAKSLKMEVIAEGVETSEQLNILQKEGCHEMQGYLVSKPASPEEVSQLFWDKDNLSEFLER